MNEINEFQYQFDAIKSQAQEQGLFNDKFQYQFDAIKRLITEYFAKHKDLFQYQFDAIKSALFGCILVSHHCFNTSLMQLKDYGAFIWVGYGVKFQYQFDAIKSTNVQACMFLPLRFNTSLMQLKALKKVQSVKAQRGSFNTSLMQLKDIYIYQSV